MKISTIIAVYNIGELLPRCLESLLAARTDEVTSEIVLVNDGSTDNSPVICARYASIYPNVQLFSQQNMGASSARKLGVFQASGEWCTFVDSDDYVCKDYYQKINEIIENYEGYDVIGLDYYRIKGGIQTRTQAYSQYNTSLDHQGILRLFKNISKKDFLFATWNKIYRREVLDLSYFDEGRNLGEDTLLNIQVFYGVKRAIFLEEAIYNYVFNPDSMTMRDYRPQLQEELESYFAQKLKYYKERPELNHAAYLKEIAKINVGRTFYALLSNIQSMNATNFIANLKKIRNSETIEFGFQNCRIADFKNIKTRITLGLLKYRRFRTLQLIYNRK